MKKYTIVFGILLSLGLTTCYAGTQGHLEIQKIVERHSTFKNIPITAVDKHSVVLQIGANTFATGAFDKNSKRVFVGKISRRDTFRHTVFHEGCTFIWDKARPELKLAYSRAFQMHSVSVSRYGRQDVVNNFSEICARINGSAYRNYTLPKGYLETSDQYRLAHLILSQWMGN